MLNKRKTCAYSDGQLFLCIVIILSVVKTCRCAYAITIHNNTDVSYFTCGEAVTLTCNFDTVPSFGMSWQLNGTNIADCISGVCYPDTAHPAYISYSVGGGDTIYNLTIDAVTTAMDGTVLRCNEISSTPDNIELNVAVPIVNGSIAATSNATHINMFATTGCVFPYKAEAFTIDFWTSQNVSVEDYVTITEHFEEGSVCPGSSVCDSKPVTKYIEFTERNDTEATTIYARILHHGIKINTVPTTNKYSIVPCNSSQSFCATTKTCVNKCDNIKDCSDESDEQDCSTKPTPGNKIEPMHVVIGLACTAGVLFVAGHVIIIFHIRRLPGAPKGLKMVQTGKGNCELTWEKPDKDGGSHIKGYIIEKEENRKWNQCNSIPVQNQIVVVTRLDEGQEVRFRVKAVNEHGESPASECTALQTITYPTTNRTTPTVLKIEFYGQGNCHFKWNKPDVGEGENINEYEIEIERVEKQGKLSRRKETTTDRYFILCGLVNGEVVKFRVKAVYDNGTSEPSYPTAPHEVRFPMDLRRAPFGLKMRFYDKGCCMLKWKKPANDSDLQGYNIEIEKHGAWNKYNENPVRGTTFILNGLDEGLVVRFCVVAVYKNRKSEFSDPTAPRTVTYLINPPSAPTDVEYNKEICQLKWNKPSDDGGRKIKGYIVEMATNKEDWKPCYTSPKQGTQYDVTNYLLGKIERFRVKAVNDVGESKPSIAKATLNVSFRNASTPM